jgi:hypothetical protein
VPLFLAILLVVRGLPALLYRSLATGRETAGGALLQATSVGFLVVATQIGQDMELTSAANAAAVRCRTAVGDSVPARRTDAPSWHARGAPIARL